MKLTLTTVEFQILEVFWRMGPCSVREVQQSFPNRNRPAYTTIQTVICRLERKKAVRRVKRIGNANVFEVVITPEKARHRLFDHILSIVKGRMRLLMAHLVESGELSIDDIKEAERALRANSKQEKHI